MAPSRTRILSPKTSLTDLFNLSYVIDLQKYLKALIYENLFLVVLRSCPPAGGRSCGLAVNPQMTGEPGQRTGTGLMRYMILLPLYYPGLITRHKLFASEGEMQNMIHYV